MKEIWLILFWMFGKKEQKFDPFLQQLNIKRLYDWVKLWYLWHYVKMYKNFLKLIHTSPKYYIS